MSILAAVGGESGCERLAAAFYGRVGRDPALRRLFPGRSLRCATEAFESFLVQFLDGDEARMQHRWWLSLRESHGRFAIRPEEREAWMRHMRAALAEVDIEAEAREALERWFAQGANYVSAEPVGEGVPGELGRRWQAQLRLDEVCEAIAAGRDEEVLALAAGFRERPSVWVGVLAWMAQSGRPALIQEAVTAVRENASLTKVRFAGRTLLHFAAGAGCVPLVRELLSQGADAAARDTGGHSPLYRAANECGSAEGPLVAEMLVRRGADVNGGGGTTPLHMAARRGHLAMARRLLELGADGRLRDSKGDTPLQRATNCRRSEVAELLRQWERSK